MPDPGFLPGFIGAVIAQLLKQVLEEADKVVHCEEYCNDLKKMLKSLQPVLEKLASDEVGNVSEDVRHWLDSLKECLRQTLVQIQKCSRPQEWYNVPARHTLSQDTLRVKKDLELLLKEPAMVSLRILTGIDNHLTIIDNRIVRLTEITLAQTTLLAQRKTFAFRIPAVAGSSSSQSVSTEQDGQQLKAPLFGGPPASSSCFNILALPPPDISLIGISEEMSALSSWLLGEEHPLWISISGIGSSGKSFLARTVCLLPEVRQHFQDRILWVGLGKNPQVQELQRDLCEIISGREAKVLPSPEDGFNVLRGLASNQRYLMVLDDAWLAESSTMAHRGLKSLNFLDSTCGSRMIVTSRDRSILSSLGLQHTEYRYLELRGLSTLFCKHVFNAWNLEEYTVHAQGCGGLREFKPVMVEFWDDLVDPEDMREMWSHSEVTSEWLTRQPNVASKVPFCKDSDGQVYLTRTEMRVRLVISSLSDLAQAVAEIVLKNYFESFLDPHVLCAIAEVESSLRPLSYGYEPESKDASTGLMNVLQSTADWLARDMGYTAYPVDWTFTMLYKPFVSVYYGAAYLKWLSTYEEELRRLYQCLRSLTSVIFRQRDEEFVVCAYHTGPRNTSSPGGLSYWSTYKAAKRNLR